jgi:aspartate 1-decarboxylase
MLVQLLKSKIHRATVTCANLNYQGSISIDEDLCKLANIMQWERVDIYNVTTGARLSTYVIFGNKGEITLNGAAARHVQPGDKVILATYAMFDQAEAQKHKPTVILVDDQNRPLPVQ